MTSTHCVLFDPVYFIRSVLTQGRVDGTGGRGFYGGLEESLLHLLGTLRVSPCVRVFCSGGDDTTAIATTAAAGTDMLLRGIWKPVSTILSEKFPGMFSVGVAMAMHRAYSAVETFLMELPSLLAGDGHSESPVCCDQSGIEAARRRINRSHEVNSFRSKWKLDIYFQVCQRFMSFMF